MKIVSPQWRLTAPRAEKAGEATRFLTRKKAGPILFTLAAAATLATIPAAAFASTQASPVVGHVYVNDNTAGANTIGALTVTPTER
jgi:hypothetical protein